LATILVRNIEDAVHDRLRERARSHGRSMEAELRDILRGAVEGQIVQGAVKGPGLGTLAANLFKGIGLREGEELETPPPIEIEPPVFE
jgi:plasmid stability protein